ncbi:acetylserotonin O-methyltransferase isoform X2 [Girardinichthys multiradiatus]|uniref:acetylserotonin O-methyltransferase isoform X2 n=1 Tax=Girardinichthys multiradiatus TaxID=208333 RepID=UPI001FAE6545|nr:acetylserotonin O-methyltransferase isoform X2 [Girardinichthys multiradiatus]
MAEGRDAGSTQGEPSAPATDMYPRKILEYMEGFLISKTVFTSCELGVFDVLLAAERPLSAEEISQAVGASLDGMQRLLAACTGLQLLNTHWDNRQVFYSNTEQSRVFLTRSSPLSLYQSIQYSSRTIYLCWHYLTDAVREGRNQYEKAFGVSSKDLFQALYRSDEEMVKFMHLMNSIWNICGKDVVTSFDLTPFKVICDLGGCSGALAKQCTLAYPECTVTIFDLPKVVRVSREHFVTEADQRIGFQEGDFFKDSLPVADLYILARILHDWTDERCIELLCRIYKVCKSGGAVLLVEALLNEDGSGPLTAQLYSLNMLVQTEGRERTGAQYAALLATSGFTNIQPHLTGKIYDVVLGHKET